MEFKLAAHLASEAGCNWADAARLRTRRRTRRMRTGARRRRRGRRRRRSRRRESRDVRYIRRQYISIHFTFQTLKGCMIYLHILNSPLDLSVDGLFCISTIPRIGKKGRTRIRT